MSLIKSISGIRGTIGGAVGDGLTPLDIVKFTSAYATFIRKTTTKTSNVIVVGRDARISGEMVNDIVEGTLVGCGFDVVNIGMASTPTTEIAVVEEDACGGIIITASHNPKQWNALKLLNENGEFLNDAQGKEVLRLAQNDEYKYACIDKIGKVYTNTTYARHHINKILALDKDGILYVWGEGYGKTPTKVSFYAKVIDMSGKLILSEYSPSDLSTKSEPFPLK